MDIEKINQKMTEDKNFFEKGLYTYRIQRDAKKSIHIQLRIKDDKDGILFIDLNDVLHLNKSATLIFKLLLDGNTTDCAYTYIKDRYLENNFSRIREEIDFIKKIIIHLSDEHRNCYVCDFLNKFKQVPIFSQKVTAPYKIDLALTYGCNNACSHCYNEENRFGMISLKVSEWFKVIDKLVFEGIPHLIITGGEATLHPDLPEIIEYADKKGMVVGLNTNGRRLADKNYLSLLQRKGLNHVQFTLGSHIAEDHNEIMKTDSFEQTITGINNAIDSGLHVITNTTIVQKNKKYLTEHIQFLNDLGIKTFAMNGLIYSGGGSEMGEAIPEYEMKILLDQILNISIKFGMKFLWYSPTEYCRINPLQLGVGVKRCNAGEYSLCIEPNGNVLPCQSYYHATGNILHDSWDDIWKNELNTSFRERENGNSIDFLPGYCDSCPLLTICGGGCKIERDSAKGIDAFDNYVSDDDSDGFSPTKNMKREPRAKGIKKRIY